MLKFGILLFAGFLFICCGESLSQNVKVSPKSTSNETDWDARRKSFHREFFQGLKDRLKKEALSSGLSPLIDSTFPKEDIEIRFYLFPSYIMPSYKGSAVEKSLFQLKRSGSNWSAKIIRETLCKNNSRERITETLNSPKSNWENLWKQLQNGNILTIETGIEDGLDPDTWLYIIETKVDGEYRYFYFWSPNEKSEVKESVQIAKIFNLIAEEFDVSDVKAN
ncbi:MAG: hypothetical protein AAB336_13865 [Acidobacteriota bacterium]